ncbi:uncharacterized protein LOC143881131 [Tasmannia lanceolata]|uniref:uncharacterized protein LOC143881131 n=1 Tax=Tasmannia lanceolata TaxID=3420 RepID=UPI004063E015
MEVPNSIPQTQNPTSSTQNPPSTNPQNNKRKLENADFQNSKYFKIRSIIKDLRPSFIEALRAPDFRNCKAAHEIRKQMQIMIELSKQLRMETVTLGNPKKPSGDHSLPAEITEVPTEKRQNEKPVEKPHHALPTEITNAPAEKLQVEKPVEKPQPDKVREKIPEKLPEEKKVSREISEKNSDEGVLLGTYVVGGSPIGWNFTMYPGSKPVYYGVTKESRASRQTIG